MFNVIYIFVSILMHTNVLNVFTFLDERCEMHVFKYDLFFLVLGWQTHWLRGRPDCFQTNRSGEKEEQGRSVSEAFSGELRFWEKNSVK